MAQGVIVGGRHPFAFVQAVLLNVVLALVMLLLIGATSVQAFTATTVGDVGNVTVMEVEGNYDAKLPDGTINSGPRRAIAREFFRTHRDTYDFLIIFSNFDFAMPEERAAAFYSTVKNDTQGIGQAIFDNTSLYGSNGKLQGTVDMGNLAKLGTSPQDVAAYDTTLDILSHELLHRWGAYIRFVDETGHISTALLSADEAHWSYLLDSAGSLEYGNDWRANNDGTFTSQAIRKYFSPLDLYLMGMIDKSAVPPMLLIENPAIDSSTMPKLGDTISGFARTVSIDDIIAAMGEREPAAGAAQKSFSAAFIFVTSPGTFSKESLYGIENLRNGFLTRFSILTDGAGLVQVTPKSLESLPTNPGVQTPSTLPRTTPPKVEDGVTWLLGQQSADGSWFANDQTSERDTAESVLALDAFVEGQSAAQRGLDWLTANSSANTDYLARRIEVTLRKGGDLSALVTELTDRQNRDGGWGLNRGFVSNPADTGLALKALAGTGLGQEALAPAIAYLRGTQNSDGGWSAIGTHSLIQPTAQALLALHQERGNPLVAPALQRGASWLAAKQNSDGGFGNSPSTVYDSAVAILALSGADLQRSAVSDGVGYLLQTQGKNGSWNGSSYQTAAAVRAVWAGTIDPDLAIKAEDLSFIPTQISTLPTNATISATLWNNGRTDIPQVVVALYRDAVTPANLVEQQLVAVPGLTPVVVTFATTITSGGEHPFIVVVDPDKLVAESNENNNQARAVLYPEANHDFLVQSADLRLSTRESLLGETVTADFILYNRGTEAVSGLPVVLAIGAPNPRTVDTLVVDIPAGDSIRGQLKWQVDQVGNDLPLAVIADPGNLFREKDETNNTAATTITVLTAPLSADLRITAESISFTPSTVTVLPTVAEIVVVVANVGETAVHQATVTAFSGTPESGSPIGSHQVNIPARSSAELRFPVSISSGNAQLFTVVADPNKEIAEWREDNNQATALLPVAAQYDFSVDAAELVVTPQPASVGAPVTVSARIANRGTLPAYNVQVRFNVQAEGQSLNIATLTLDLPAGETVARSFAWIPAVAGQGLALTVEVDPFQQYAEISETNNVASKLINISGWSLPNLTVVHQNLTVTPSPAKEGGSANIQALVVNNGYAPATNVRVDFYLGIPNYGGELLGTVQVPSIAAAGSAPATLAWTKIPLSGTKLIYVVIDSAEQIEEIDELDNDNFIELKILSLPDLLVESGAINLDPAMPRAGASATVTVTVRNIGEQAAGPVTVQILDGLELLAETTVLSVEGLSQQNATLAIVPSEGEGEKRLTVVVDPLDLIVEQLESNNAAEISFAVQNSDLWLTHKYFSPNGDGVQDETTLYFRLLTPQKVEIRIVDAEGKAVRQLIDSQWEMTDYGQAVWDGLDDLGRVVDDGTYRMAVVNPAGVQVAQAQVVVDTNRTPITEAIGTPYLYQRNLGELPANGYIDALPDESGYLFKVGSYDINNKLPTVGLYFWGPESNTVEALTPPEWFFSPYELSNLSYIVSPDGSSIAIVFRGVQKIKYSNSNNYYTVNSYSKLWLYDRNSRLLQLLDESRVPYWNNPAQHTYGNIADVAFSPDGRRVTYAIAISSYKGTSWPYDREKMERRIVDIQSKEAKTLYAGESDSVRWSSQSDIIAFWADGMTWIARQGNGASLPTTDPLPAGDGVPQSWSPDGKKLAIVNYDGTPQITVYEPALGSRLLFQGESEWGSFEGWLNNSNILYFDSFEQYGYDHYLLINTETPAEVFEINQIENQQSVSKLLRSPKDNYLLFADAETMRIYDTAKRQSIFAAANPFKGPSYSGPAIDAVWDENRGKVYLIGPTRYFEDNYNEVSYGYDYQGMEIDLASGKTRSLNCDNDQAAQSSRLLFEGALFSVQYPDKDIIVAVDPVKDQPSVPVASYDSISSLGISPLGSSLNFIAENYDVDSEPVLYRVRSLLNLVADLHTIKTRSGIEVKGSTADRYFAGYRLEYSEVDAPDEWTLLQSGSDKSIIDQEITTWVPPQEGTFLLRLTAWDLAGNSAVDQKRISWGESLSVANFSKSDEIISPNNDQIKDAVTLSYRVLFPVHLEFRILNAENQVVRTILKDHSLIGPQMLIWDGKDEDGVVVPDGTYRITVFDYKFAVVVDSTPPQSILTLGPVVTDIKKDQVRTDFFAQADDLNLKQWQLEKGIGTDPTEWIEVSFGDQALTHGKALETFVNEELQSNSGYLFRLTVEDYAGNRSSSLAGPISGRLILFNADKKPLTFNPESLRPAGGHQLLGISTFVPALSDLQVECRVKATWIASPAQLLTTNGGIEIDWDNTPCGQYGNAVRLKGRLASGQVITSNELGYQNVFSVKSVCDPPSIEVENWLYEELTNYEAQYQDAAGKWNKYLELDSGYVGEFVISPPPMASTNNFFVRLIGRGVLTGKVYQTQPLQFNCRITGNTGEGGVDSISSPQSGCGVVTNLKSFSIPLDGPIEPLKMQVFLADSGQEELLGEKDGTSTMSVDLSALTEGSHSFRIVLSYRDPWNGAVSQLEELIENYQLDLTLPTATMNYPQGLVGYCPGKPDELFGGQPAFTVEGIVADTGGVASYEVVYRKATSPANVPWENTGINGNKATTGSLGLWKPEALNPGGYTLELRVKDNSGNMSCTQSHFTIVSPVLITRMEVDESIFSPNGDTFKDELRINYEIASATFVDLVVMYGAEPVRHLQSNAFHLGGPASLTWNGHDDAGNIVADGIYTIYLTSCDGCQYPDSKAAEVLVHNSPPRLEFTAPNPLEELGIVVEIRGTVTDPYLTNYKLEVGSGAEPANWTILASDAKSVSDIVLTTWNTFGLEGMWTFRLSAEDSQKNRAEKSLTFSLGERVALIKSLEAEPKLFAPNNDGVLERTTIRYELTTNSLVDLEIIDSDGIMVLQRKLVDVMAPGPHQEIWNGLDVVTGKPLPSGVYSLVIKAISADNPEITQQERITLSIDLTPPVVKIDQPEEEAYLNAAAIALLGTITDPHLESYTIRLHGPEGGQLLVEGSRPLNDQQLAAVPELVDGVYKLEIEAVDELANRSTLQRNFTVDRTPPQVKLLTPLTDHLFGQDNGLVAIVGEIVEVNPEAYRLGYRRAGSTEPWIVLKEEVAPTSLQVNYLWQVGIGAGIADGEYELSLWCRDRAGQESELLYALTIDNSKPVVSFENLPDGSYVRNNDEVIGTIKDMNLDQATLELASGACAPDLKWSSLGQYRTTTEKGRLYIWNLLPDDGNYCLKLSALDKLGARSDALAGIIVDTHPPSIPVPAGEIVAKTSNHLSWKTVPESDLAGYRLYRNGVVLNVELLSGTDYLDENLLEGVYRYQLKAIDHAGNESALSEPVTLTIDLVGPTTNILNPGNISLIQGVVAIKGTAFASDDFREYRVYVGQGTIPSEWTLLRRSPIPVSAGVLVDWNTLQLPEAEYAIKLEAEDLSGNVTVKTISVMIDNTPPEAPLLVSAQTTTADVTVLWNNNSETDLAGYLLFRNGQLVNADGPVIGSWQPYLLRNTTFTDTGLVDGKHSYYLLAMDLAGNVSVPSNVKEVTIDLRAPRATIVDPGNGFQFESPLTIIAESPDLDVASVRFQYRPVGASLWQDLGETLTSAPYIITLDPVSLALAYGEYQFQAIATDLNGQQDANPSIVRFEYRDLTPPAPLKGLTASFACDAITLSWTANSESDLAGYNVYMVEEDESLTSLNDSMLTTTTWVESGRSEGTYTFIVRVSDHFGNESEGVEKTVELLTPIWDGAEALTVDPKMNLSGTDAYANNKVQLYSNGLVIAETLSDATGIFTFSGVLLEHGMNDFSAMVLTADGSQSCSSNSLSIKRSKLLPPPEWLESVVNGLDVELHWNPLDDPELSGYNVYRGENRRNWSKQIPATDFVVTANEYYGSASASPRLPAYAVDDNTSTSWLTNYNYGSFQPKWLQFDFARPRKIDSISINWLNNYCTGRDFGLQLWDGNNWVTVAQVTGNSYYYDSRMTITAGFSTEKIRLYITANNNSANYVAISELFLYEDPLITSTSFIDQVYQDGTYNYQIASVNRDGFEGPLSPMLSVGFGDTEPPAPPVNLEVMERPDGHSLLLTWEDPSADTYKWRVYRSEMGGGPYAEVANRYAGDALSLIDQGLTPGSSYFYVVTALDEFGNESAYSEEVFGIPQDTLPPLAPSFLYPTVPGRDTVVVKNTTDIKGLSESGTQVQLFVNGQLQEEVRALVTPVANSEVINFVGYDARLSSSGSYLVYVDDNRYDYGLVLRNLASGEETLVSENVDSYVWSVDGNAITYLYDDGESHLAQYLVATGERILLPTDSGAYLDYLSSSADGNIVAYMSDQNGDEDLWVQNRQAGTTTQITSGLSVETTAVAPDGSKVAYYDDDDEILYVLNLVNNETVEVDFDPRWTGFEWSLDSRNLAFLSYRNGNGDRDIFVYDTITASVTQVMDVTSYKYTLHWSPDGKVIVYNQEDDEDDDYESIRMVSLSGDQKLLASGQSDVTMLQWQPYGEIVFIDDDSSQVNHLLPPGLFTFESVPLTPGENQFFATATDAAGNVSPTSEPISVIFDTKQLPDITVAAEDLFLFPAVPAPGEKVLANITVRNLADVALGQFNVDIYLWDAQGELRLLETQSVDQLAAKGAATLSVAFVAPDQAGSASLLVVADPGAQISELVESNNFASREFKSSTTIGVELTTSLNAVEFTSHQEVAIDLELLNNGLPLHGQLEVLIEDAAGNLVTTLKKNPVALTYGLIRSTYRWETGITFAGNYQVHSSLHDSQGTLLAEERSPFVILADQALDLTITTDRASYGPNQTVALAIELGQAGKNSILAAVALRTRILDSAGTELYTTESALTNLLPGSINRLTESWKTALAQPGDYTIKVEALADGQVLKSVTKTFAISGVSLVYGTLAVEPLEVVYGISFQLPFTTGNRGNFSADGRLMVSLLDSNTLETVAVAEQPVTLAVAGEFSGIFPMTTTGLGQQNYRAQLHYLSGAGSRLLAETTFRVIDGIAPMLAIASPQSAQTYRLNVDLAATASDDLSGVASVSYRLDGGEWQVMPFADLASGRYALTWHPTLADNGAHTIEFVAVDRSGNRRQSEALPFEVQMDTTPPVTALEIGQPHYLDVNGVLYLAGATSLSLVATDDLSGVAGTEVRIDSGLWQPYTGPLALSGLTEGEHEVGYRSIDAFENRELEKSKRFIIDNTAPVISFPSLKDGAYYKDELLPLYATSDQVPEVVSQAILTLDNVVVDGTIPVGGEGEYRYAITATDRLGHQRSTELRFTIDRTAPQLSVAGIVAGGFYKDSVQPLPTIVEPHLEFSSTTLNGEPWDGRLISADGHHTLVLYAKDKAANESTLTLDFNIDNTAPVTTISSGNPKFSNEALYVSSATVLTLVATDNLSGVTKTEYRLDGGLWTDYAQGILLADLADGAHTVGYRSRDFLGNLEVEQTLPLVLDNTPPQTASTLGIPLFTADDGTLFVTVTTTVELTGVDTLSGVATIAYRLDEGDWTTYVGPLSLTALADGPHLLAYRATDRLGNVEIERRLPLTVDNTPPTIAMVTGTPQLMATDGTLFVTGATPLNLTATDALSGVAGSEYRLDSGDWIGTSGVITLAGLGDRPHLLGYRSRDQLGNMAEEQTLALTVDNTPAVTTLSIGLPQVADSKTLYVTSATPFTISASDPHSGPATSEVRIDGGTWVPYNPFTLSGEGEHTVEYRSRDQLDNLESAKTQTVTLDDSPPLVTIAAGEPRFISEDGTLYVAPHTLSKVSAADSLSGVEKVEYRVDGNPWIASAPFALATEGIHTLEARAYDRLGNTTPLQSLAISTDATPPRTAVTFAGGSFLDGTEMIMAGETDLILTATDSLSGVDETFYRLDNQTEWSLYQGPVSLAELSPGKHRLQVQSVDQVENREMVQSVDLTRMAIAYTSAPLTVPRVLVWLPTEDDDHSEKEDEEKEDHEDGKRHEGEDSTDSVAERLLVAAFAGRDVYHTVVRNEEAFVRELRSGLYNVLVLLGPEDPTNTRLLGEIRAAVRRGMGLVAASWKKELHPQLRDLFGVTPNGSKKLAEEGEGSFLFAEPFGPAAALNLVGTLQRVKLAGGELAGILPAPEVCDGIRSIALRLPIALSVGDRVEVRLGRREGRKDRLLEKESWSVSRLPVGTIDAARGGIDGNLVLTGLTASGVDLALNATHKDLEKDYTLTLTVEHRGKIFTTGSVLLSGECAAKLQTGVKVGPFQVMTVAARTEREGEDLPVVVVNRFGEGAAVLFNFDPVAAAKGFGIADQATLLGKAMAWAAPAQEEPRAAGVLLLANRLDLVGMAGDLTATERPGRGLSSPAFFALPSAPFSRSFSLRDGESAEYRYLLRFADSSGLFAKEMELNYQSEVGPVLIQRQTLSFAVTDSSAVLLNRALAWVDQQVVAHPGHDDGDREREEHSQDRDEDDEDRDDDEGFAGLRQRLLRIGCLRWDSGRDLEKVIAQTLMAIDRAEGLADPADEVHGWLAEYLRIAEAAWFAISRSSEEEEQKEHSRDRD